MNVSNGQRALWMVLITSLAAPFFAALTAVAMALVTRALGAGGLFGGADAIGDVAVAAFAWSALPATLAALGLALIVVRRATYSWLEAAVAGVLAFTLVFVILPFNAGGNVAPFAFLAGLIAILLRAMLIHGRILRHNAAD
ncbi:MAG: hypothetical protein ACRCS9_02570 [Hyphomicrobium sp.]